MMSPPPPLPTTTTTTPFLLPEQQGSEGSEQPQQEGGIAVLPPPQPPVDSADAAAGGRRRTTTTDSTLTALSALYDSMAGGAWTIRSKRVAANGNWTRGNADAARRGREHAPHGHDGPDAARGTDGDRAFVSI